MKIGIPKEIKDQEYRVALLPSAVSQCVAAGHKVIVESGAGEGVGVGDQVYKNAGADIASATAVYAGADLIVKIKEPQLQERRGMLREGQVLFSYLHLAPDSAATQDLLDCKVTGLAFETVTDKSGTKTPLLAPMSQIAGRLAAMVGAQLLEKNPHAPDRMGKLVMGVPGVEPARYVVVGGGVVGENAIEFALGLGAQVTVFDLNAERLTDLSNRFPALVTRFADSASLKEVLSKSDVAIGAIHTRGSQSGHIVNRAMVAEMPRASVIVDVCIDQGGCFETSRPTNHSQQTYLEEGVVHYCVSNMPGIVPLTASQALNHAITPYVLQIANLGFIEALRSVAGLADGLNVYQGKVTNRGVAEAQGRDWVSIESALS